MRLFKRFSTSVISEQRRTSSFSSGKGLKALLMFLLYTCKVRLTHLDLNLRLKNTHEEEPKQFEPISGYIPFPSPYYRERAEVRLLMVCQSVLVCIPRQLLRCCCVFLESYFKVDFVCASVLEVCYKVCVLLHHGG